MIKIAIKEFKNFFNDLIGIGFLSSFFLLTGFFSWYVEGNIIEFGYAELSVFFTIVPWFFLLLTPALAMKLIGEEYENKTIDLLLVQNISPISILIGKLLGGLLLILICLFISLIYVISVGYLGNPTFNFDGSVVIGQYLGIILANILFLNLSFLGNFIAKKQALGFLLGLFLNFIVWEIPSLIENFSAVSFLNLFSNSPLAHFNNITKGLIEYSDMAYFIGINIILFGLNFRLLKASSN